MHQYKALFRDYFMNKALTVRQENHYSQEKMAELLRISPRSYSDLEHGKYCFSAGSLLFLLFQLTEDDVVTTINTVHELVDKADDDGFTL